MSMFYHSLARCLRPVCGLGLALLPLAGRAQTTIVTPTTVTPISLTALNTPYTQDFSVLASTGTTGNTLPTGWSFVESAVAGATAAPDNMYTVSTGSTGTGNTYSFGAAGTNPITDRAFGTVNGASSTTNATTSNIGAVFVNNTGQTITGLNISYAGEQWRVGSSTRTNVDRFDFQYQVGGTNINSGTFVDYNALDFNSPHTNDGSPTGPLDGNAPANRSTKSSIITGISIPNGSTFVLRWFDFDVTGGGDDGLGVDDVSVAALAGTPPTIVTNTATVTGTTAALSGNASSAGSGGSITARGFVYSSTNQTPILGGTGVTTVTAGTGTGTFNGSAAGLSLYYTTYYVAAYVTTSAGTFYGAVQTFTTGPGTISLTAVGTAYTQDFNTLASSGTANTKSTLPAGWDFVEVDLSGGTADNTYSASTPSTGNTFSLGGNTSSTPPTPSVNPVTERAFGGVQNANILPYIGAAFTNNTGQALAGVRISYTGEQWRLGNDTRTVADRIDFQYSTTATDLATGTFTDWNPLDFTGPIVGTAAGTGVGMFLDGNLPANRRALSATIPVSIAAGATFYIRWEDFNAPGGADDPLGVDDFSLTPLTTLATAAPRAAASLRCYPNPAQGQVQVAHPAAPAGARLTLYSATGQVAATVAVRPGSTATDVSLSGLAAGIYLAEYADGAQRQTGKVVKE